MAAFVQYDVGGNDSFTKLLVHCDGVGGTNAFTDFSASGQIITAQGAATVSTSQSVFGGASVSLGAATNDLSVTDNAAFILGTNDFTFDFWVFFSTVPSGGLATDISRVFFFQEDASINRIVTGLNAAGGIFWISQNAPAVLTSVYFSSTPAFSASTWTHIALVRSGTSFFIFVNGTSISLTESTPISTNSLNDIAGPFIIGATNVLFSGPTFLDEFRFSNGIARWTTNFAPPVEPYG